MKETFNIQEFLSENKITVGIEDGMNKSRMVTESLEGDVQVAAKKVAKLGGNDVNITDYGLTDVASLLDTYGPQSREPIYSKRTLGIFKQLLASFVSDEVQNNQDDTIRR